MLFSPGEVWDHSGEEASAGSVSHLVHRSLFRGVCSVGTAETEAGSALGRSAAALESTILFRLAKKSRDGIQGERKGGGGVISKRSSQEPGEGGGGDRVAQSQPSPAEKQPSGAPRRDPPCLAAPTTATSARQPCPLAPPIGQPPQRQRAGFVYVAREAAAAAEGWPAKQSAMCCVSIFLPSPAQGSCAESSTAPAPPDRAHSRTHREESASWQSPVSNWTETGWRLYY